MAAGIGLASAPARRIAVSFAAPLALALPLALAPLIARAEPPDAPGLVCTVQKQRLEAGMSLEIRFTNESDADLSLGPGPHLVWFRDAGAQDAMTNTARATRLQNAPLVVPAKGERVALFSIERGAVDELRCNPARPAGAALYFYQFNPRPRFRCLLRGYDVAAVALKRDCPAPTLLAPATTRP